MGLVTKQHTFSAGTIIVASEHNANFDDIYNEFNGNIANANLHASAAIADTKLAQISTAGKVKMTALTETSEAQGDLIIHDGTDWSRLGAGTLGQYLYTAGSSADPAWSSIAAGDLPAGSIVQIVNTQTGASGIGTTIMPYDDTIPQKTEGDEYMTLAITPATVTNKLKIDVVWIGAVDIANVLTVALFKDTVTNASAAAISSDSVANHRHMIPFSYYMVAGTTSSTTFKVRAGAAGVGRTTFNGSDGARYLGGALKSSITITEIKA